MAHGSKRWIEVEGGRLKRSRQRTWLDRRVFTVGLYGQRDDGAFSRARDDVPRSPYDRVITTWSFRWTPRARRRLARDRSRATWLRMWNHRQLLGHDVELSWYEPEAGSYEDRQRKVARRKRNYVPSWAGRAENQLYRARSKALMRRAWYDERYYDDLAPPKRCVQYKYA